eukprot:COSAG01_NODE_54697_length_330_cov_0.896104_1_plen_61_part_10
MSALVARPAQASGNDRFCCARLVAGGVAPPRLGMMSEGRAGALQHAHVLMAGRCSLDLTST